MDSFVLLRNDEKLFIDKINSIDANEIDGYGSSLLQNAIAEGKIAAAMVLVDRGADIDFQDKDGKTPLHYALIFGITAVSEKLIQIGANVNIKDKHGNNAIWVALLNNGKINMYLLPSLLNAGADSHSVNVYNKSTLDIVRQMNLKELNEIFGLASNSESK